MQVGCLFRGVVLFAQAEGRARWTQEMILSGVVSGRQVFVNVEPSRLPGRDILEGVEARLAIEGRGQQIRSR